MKIESAAPLLLVLGPAIALSLLALSLLGRRRRAARGRYIDGFDFARLLDQRLARRRPELDPTQRARVIEGLREWFHLHLAAGRRQLSMPSQAVDDAWHEFILFTRNYQDFCRRGLGRFLHHVPAEAMATPTQASTGLRRSWRLACRRAGIDPKAPATLPLLFALDGELGLADGFRYRIDCLAAGGARNGTYCAAHIGCGSGCSSDGGSGGDGCSGGCGGD